ncbi:AbrB family transcriptional regulator [Candidatus Acetothermia bacterium]|nr:MAG: AbrB family transcriptional regulator [Candidatus Acetothermia bacterium]RLE32601.1 MAG: AbrB family transcriptional regulator [Candidatus Acetothermia bacterium]
MVTISKVTSKGQATIPKEVRELLGIRPGDKVAFVVRGDTVVVIPVRGTLRDLRGSIRPKRVPEDLERIRLEVKKKISKARVKGS